MPKKPRDRPAFALVTGTNPAYGDWQPHLELPADLAALELALIAGPILADVDYITDYSGPSPDGRHRRYRGLDDVLDARTLARTQARLTRLLESLLDDGESWFLFLQHDLDPELLRPPALLRARLDAEPWGGAFTIFEVPAGDLDAYATLFGKCDGVSGLAAPADTFNDLLSHLSLGAAVPTSQRYRLGSPYHLTDTTALARVLAHGRLFFEEIDNGTRLRLIAKAPALAPLRARLAAPLA